MRTLDAELTAALESGSYEIYMSVTMGHGVITEITKTPIKYQIKPLELSVSFQRDNSALDDEYILSDINRIQITRGVTVNGINYTISTSKLYVTNTDWDGQFSNIE